MKKCLLLVAHGSRRAQSNDEVRALTERLRAQATTTFADVDCAFLELAEPSIPDGLEQLASRGATQITVLPYFLAAGRHVAEDIPAEVEIARQRLSGVAIDIAPYLGTSASLPQLMLAMLDDRAVAAH